MIDRHRVLVCGVGSIGERHIRNLVTLGCTEIAVFRTRNLPFRTLDRELPVYTNLALALRDFQPTAVFVTNPTALHLPIALDAARAGCHLFLEKPVSSTLDGITEVQDTLRARHRFAMVGYMLRFHPLLMQVKAWLEEGPAGTLGRPLFARVSWGEHVPDWHPWEDYRESYAVRADLGGGPTLTLSHELDLLVWMFGPVQFVIGMPSRHTPLEIDCEHTVDILARFGGGVTANVHLDYCQRPPQRSWELVCARGRIVFDYYGGTLTRYDGIVGEIPPSSGADAPVAETVTTPEGFDRNDLFLAELRYFFECIDAGKQPAPGLMEAAESVRIALSALREETPSVPLQAVGSWIPSPLAGRVSEGQSH